jgi:hypothetical protein
VQVGIVRASGSARKLYQGFDYRLRLDCRAIWYDFGSDVYWLCILSCIVSKLFDETFFFVSVKTTSDDIAPKREVLDPVR